MTRSTTASWSFLLILQIGCFAAASCDLSGYGSGPGEPDPMQSTSGGRGEGGELPGSGGEGPLDPGGTGGVDGLGGASGPGGAGAGGGAGRGGTPGGTGGAEAAGPPPPDCTGGSQGAYCTRRYRNLLAEIGVEPAAIAASIDRAYRQYFTGDLQDERLYYPAGSDSAYILDVHNDDVRSEGISYGMMIAVQLDRREEFDRLWTWADRHMRHKSGARAGYFAWRCSRSGAQLDQNPASDGEEYIAMALYFAAGRWGSRQGLYDYRAQADAILHTMLHKEAGGVVDSVTNMFNRQNKLVVFTPYAQAATFTDPSYHLPAFYELWRRWAPRDNAFWGEAAAASRAFFKRTTHPATGLAPDYATFEGAPYGAGMNFHVDAWRVIGNIAMDAAWFPTDAWAAEHARRYLDFFRREGLRTYLNQYTIAGQRLSGHHSPGLVAMNALGALSLPPGQADDFVRELWALQPPRGRYRYYDGMLYFLALLHASGNFRIYSPAAR